MSNILTSYLQYVYPKHALSALAGKLANSDNPKIKDFLINQFVKSFQVDMSSAQEENPNAFATFNDFFIRKLKPELRPIASNPQIACPVDGTVSQIGSIKNTALFQAKNFYYDLASLLANEQPLVDAFTDGSFATLYLAPHNYHRVHMPLDGELQQSIFVPGKLFSVNNTTADYIPNLFARNERVINIFSTAVGPMAVILVGALIVGSMQMSWQEQALRHKTIVTKNYGRGAVKLAKGEELGLFKLGSTVILLFGKNRVEWSNNILPNSPVIYGMPIGKTLES